jgi:hypothetical protein
MLLALVILALVAAFAVAEIAAQDPNGGVVLNSAEPDLLLNGTDDWYGPVITVAGLQPGDAGQETIELQTTGAAGNVTMKLLNLVDSGNETSEPELVAEGGVDTGQLSANLDVRVWLDNNNNGEFDGTDVEIASGKLQSIVGPEYELGTLGLSDTMYVVVGWSLPGTVGNEVHEDKSTFDIFFGIEQIV